MAEIEQEPCLCSRCILHSQGNEAYLNSFPPGYRFRPTDEELVMCYLRKKVREEELPINRINDVNLYELSPQELSQYPPCEENNWYFFTPRDRKYAKGWRPDRAAKDGYWRANSADKEIKENGRTIGSKRSMVYHLLEEKPQPQPQPQSNGKRKKRRGEGKPTSWIIHEYILKDNFLPIGTGDNGMRLDTWVLCRLHKKKNRGKDGNRSDESGDETGDERTKQRNTIGDGNTEPSNQEVGDHYNNPSMTQAVVIDNSIGHNNLVDHHRHNDQFLNQRHFHPNETFGHGNEACYTLDHNPNRMSSAPAASGPFPGSDPSPPNNGMVPYSNSSTSQADFSGVSMVGNGGSYFNNSVDQEADVYKWFARHLAPEAFTSPHLNPGSSTSMPVRGIGDHTALMSSSFPQAPPTHLNYNGGGTNDGVDYSHGSMFDSSK